MYHLELRHFPHNASRFNLSEQELQAILAPWVREQIVEVGERKWSPHMAKLTVLEGPHLGMADLRLGRGWRTAQRVSEDVTDAVLQAATEASQAEAAAGPEAAAGASAGAGGSGGGGGTLAGGDRAGVGGSGGAAALSDPVALGVLDDLRSVASLLGPDPMALLEAWRLAAARSPGLAPSESLALAEHAVRTASPDQG